MRTLFALVAAAALLVPAAPVLGSTLQIQFTGLNLQYDGNAIFDGGVKNTVRAGNPADADPLAAMQFFVDGGLIGTQLSNVWADIYIPGVTNIPVGGGTVLSSAALLPSFGFDLLTDSSTPGWGLALTLDSPMEITYSPSGFLTVLGSGMTNSIADQDLPFDLEIGTPVTMSFSSQITDMGDNGEFLTRFVSSGTGEVRGPVTTIPEPGTLMLLGLGLLGGGAVTARRRRK